MAGYFSRMFDPPTRRSFFGPQADPEDSSSDEGSADQAQRSRPFFSPDPALFLGMLNSPGLYPGSLGPSAMAGGASAIVPAVANFGGQGVPLEDYTDPNDWPWRMYPDVDPEMPFFILPPNTVFNMPVYKWKQAPEVVPPWVDEQGHPHLDNINPAYKKIVTPGKDI